jgi:outer membrane protein TolC
LRASRILLDSAEASFRVSGERFRLGVGSFTDLVQAQSAAAGARLQWAESRANLTRAHWRLAAAAGRFGALQMSMDFGQALPR